MYNSSVNYGVFSSHAYSFCFEPDGPHAITIAAARVGDQSRWLAACIVIQRLAHMHVHKLQYTCTLCVHVSVIHWHHIIIIRDSYSLLNAAIGFS